MNNEELKKNIDDAIRSGNLERFNSAVQKATIDKISALGLDEELRLTIQPLIRKFTVPVKVSYETSVPKQENEGTSKKIQLLNIAAGIVLGIVMVWLVSEIEIGLWSVLICAILVEGYFLWLNRKLMPTKKPNSEIKTVTVICANSKDVMDAIESFVDITRKVYTAGTSASKEKEGDTKEITSLYNDYPNVVKWLQNLYADKNDIDKEGWKFLFKRIPRLLDQLYYDVIMFDGNNIALFEIDRDPGVNGTEIIYPAIVDTRTGRVVLRGRVCNP